MGLCLSFLICSMGAKPRSSRPTLRHGGHKPRRAGAIASPNPRSRHRVSGPPCPQGGAASPAIAALSRPQPGRGATRVSSSPPLRGPPAAPRPSGGPRAKQMAEEASGRVSCCYLSLMTRSVNFVGNTPSCLCMPPALITVIEL